MLIADHELELPDDKEGICNALKARFGDRILFTEKGVEYDQQTSDMDNFKIIVNTRMIDWQLKRYKEGDDYLIRVQSDFEFAGLIKFCRNTVIIDEGSPIRRHHNCMQFLLTEEWSEDLWMDEEWYNRDRKIWLQSLAFMRYIVGTVGGKELAFLNDTNFPEAENCAYEGKSMKEVLHWAQKDGELILSIEKCELFYDSFSERSYRSTGGNQWFYDEL